MDFMSLLYATVDNVTFFISEDDPEKIVAEFADATGDIIRSDITALPFRSFLAMKSIELDDKKIGLNEKKTLNYIRYHLCYYQEQLVAKIPVRIDGTLFSGIEYDLQTRPPKSVLVSSSGWKISSPKAKFLPSATSMAQVVPRKSKQGLIELLTGLVNLEGDDLILFSIWVVHCFCGGSRYALLVMAERGSGKSSLSKLAQRFIDPSHSENVHLPERVDDLFVLLGQSFFVAFDNVGAISKEISDVMCGAATGTTQAKRALFTDNSLISVKLHSAFLINGIEVIPKEGDLAERMILINMKKLTPSNIMTEDDLNAMLEKRLPYILGAIFDVLSGAMQVAPVIEKKNMSRMAGAFFNMLCIARAMGIDEDQFREIFDRNVERMDRARASTPLVEAVVEFMGKIPQNKRKYSGTAADVYKAICDNYSGRKSLLPGSASQFTRKLDQESASLKAVGYRINLDDTSSSGTTVTIIRRK